MPAAPRKISTYTSLPRVVTMPNIVVANAMTGIITPTEIRCERKLSARELCFAQR